MPRSPDTYTLPPGTTPQAPNTVIGSAMFNAAMDDIATTFNTAWPVSIGVGAAGATGSWDAINAQGSDITAAASINLTTATGPNLNLVGNTNVSTVTLAAGAVRFVTATGTGQLVASANLIVNGSTTTNYTLTATELLIFIGRAGSVVKVWAIAGSVSFATRAQANAQTSTSLAVPPAYVFYPAGHLWGCTLSNSAGDPTNDIDIAAGTARSADDTYNINLAAAITGKQLDAAWAVGSSAGMRASGAAIADTTYHIFLILRPDTGVVDVAADTSVTGANIAANTNAAYTQIRRIGSIIRSAGAILPFVQYGDRFQLVSAVIDVNAGNVGSSAVTRTLTTPLGIVTLAIITVGSFFDSTRASVWISPLTAADQAAQAPGVGQSNLTAFAQVAGASNTSTGGWNFSAESFIATNTSSQIRTRASGSSSANDKLGIITHGWVDFRGTI